jgi:pimeloyl-ACP methyl ester carboxylesterase
MNQEVEPSGHVVSPALTPLSEDTPWWRIGIAPDSPRYVPHGKAFNGGNYTRLVVEFDDQGASYHEHQMEWLDEQLSAYAGQRPILLVFVHGWKHNARARDPNLLAIDTVLKQTAEAEAAVGSNRPVIGIFVGWRGLSFYAGWLTNLTFWNRKAAALRVALGSVRELFARLRRFRESRDSQSTLVIVGHSFGGLVVFSALAQSMVELALLSGPDHAEPSFANLVLLVNPAFEAARYLPIFSLIRYKQFAKQPPIMISITAKNDLATGLAFPVGAWLGSMCEHGRDPKQKQAVVHTMGHIDWLRTHTVTYEEADPAPANSPSSEQLLSERITGDQSYRDRSPGWERHFPGGAVLRQTALDPNNPFWNASASPEIIDGHTSIFQAPFLGLVRTLVAEQLRNPENAGGVAPRAAVGKIGVSSPA